MAKGIEFSLVDLSDRLRAVHSMASMCVGAIVNDGSDATAEVLQKHVCDAIESEIDLIARYNTAARRAARGSPKAHPKKARKRSRRKAKARA